MGFHLVFFVLWHPEVTSAGVFQYTSENNGTNGTIDRAEYVTVAPRKQPFQTQQNSQTDQQYPGKQSSPYNSSSGKGSITSSSNLGGSTFKGNLGEFQRQLPTK